MGTISDKLTYLGETKSILKDTINMSNANITNSTTFRNYATQLKEGYIDILNNGTDTLYNNFTHLTGKGMTLSFAPTYQAPMKISCYGSTSQASTPTPSSPVDVVNTTGNQSINVCGKNLFDENYYNDTTLYTQKTPYFCSLKLPDSFKTKFYGNMNLKGTSQSLVFGFSNSNNSVSTRMLSGGTITNNVEYDFTNANDVYLVIGNSSGINVSTDIPKIFNNYNIMVSKTSEEPYEAYNGTNYNIGLGNIELCKIGDYEDKIDKSTGKNIIGELITNSAAWASGTITARNGWSRTDYIPIKPNISYYIQHTAGSNVAYTGWCYDENKTPISSLSLNGDYDVSGAVAMPNNAKYMIINFYSATITTNLPMVNEGSTALPYEPYGKEWYIKKNIGKVVLDGSENWSKSASQGYLIGSNNTPFADRNTEVYKGLCNYFKFNESSSTWVSLYACGFNSSNVFWVREDNNVADTLEDWKTWLSTHNTEVYYPLATPTYTKITDSTLIEQLEAIKSKDNTTNITSSMVIGAIALKKE